MFWNLINSNQRGFRVSVARLAAIIRNRWEKNLGPSGQRSFLFVDSETEVHTEGKLEQRS